MRPDLFTSRLKHIKRSFQCNEALSFVASANPFSSEDQQTSKPASSAAECCRTDTVSLCHCAMKQDTCNVLLNNLQIGGNEIVL